jgi:hypothetical protein
LEKLGEGKGQGSMEVKDQEGQGPLWAVAPLLMLMMNTHTRGHMLRKIIYHSFRCCVFLSLISSFTNPSNISRLQIKGVIVRNDEWRSINKK